ncbi:MAG: SRPBCC family protein [Alphaproteobacteria bacterium]|nr:SRPBCC family protein [Alphaproteobacteria bacterium]MCW5744055.1 SRPBCC family protein [Alphaproteobacteria bacterium]
MSVFKIDPKLDLRLERVIDVKPELVWACWTMPEHIVKWFTPAPWRTKSVDIELHPGGRFNSVMLSPEGEEFPNFGCVLEVVPISRLVFTDTLLEGFRPSGKPFFSAVVEIAPDGAGTRYIATAIHGNDETRKQHEEMGFHSGWSAALDQLVALAKTLSH